VRGVPRIAAGVMATPLDTPQGLRYRLKPSTRGAGTLAPARTMLALMLMDGRRTLADILAALEGHGFRLGDPAKLIGMVRMFEAAGVVEVAHHYETPGPLRHECEGCGQSCEGHLVGPIDSSEAAELEQRLLELRADDPTLPGGPATVETEYEGEVHRVLSFPEGACIFLDPKKRCRLHAVFGPQSKPLPCRMFPVRLVRTEGGTRVALSPRCFRAHHSYRTAAPTTVEALLDSWGVWRPPALLQGLDPWQSDTLAATPEAEVNGAAEALALAQLESGERDLVALLTRVALGRPDAGPPAASARRAFARAVLRAIQRTLAERFEVLDRGTPASRFGANVAALLAGVPRLTSAVLPDGWDLPEPAADYASHGLRHFVFAREAMSFGSVSAGMLVYTMGVMLAGWLCDANPSDADPLDAFVTALTVWVRLAGSKEFQAALFPQPTDIERLLSLLVAGGGDG
jgi:Fe-S-cluster containining protein